VCASSALGERGRGKKKIEGILVKMSENDSYSGRDRRLRVIEMQPYSKQ